MFIIHISKARFQNLRNRNPNYFPLDEETNAEMKLLLVLKFFFIENKVISYLARCDFMNAVKDINQCISLLYDYQDMLYPYRFNVHLLIGIYAAMIGDTEHSLQHLHYVSEIKHRHAPRALLQKWAIVFEMFAKLAPHKPSKQVISSVFDRLLELSKQDGQCFHNYGLESAKLLIRAILCTHNNAHEDALKYLDECKKVNHNQFHNKQIQAQCLYIMGQIYRKMDDPVRGVECLSDCLTLCNNVDDLIAQFHTMTAMLKGKEECERKEQQENVFDINDEERMAVDDDDIFMATPFSLLTSSQPSTVPDSEKYKILTRDTIKKLLERIHDTKQLPEHDIVIKWFPTTDEKYRSIEQKF